MKPINNCYIVELTKHNKSQSGLELPVKEEDKHLRTGKVLEIPDGSEIKVGDTVVFGEYAYDELVFEGNLLCFVKYEDIIAIV